MRRFFKFKGYGGTWGLIIFLTIYVYVGWPVEPRMPAAWELQAMAGIPAYRHSLATKSAVGLDYFTVNNLRLNCSFGFLGGSGGCGFFRGKVDLNDPVHVTYFWMPTRWWYRYRYRLLHALEQKGRLIVSAQETYAERVHEYKTNLKIYRQQLLFIFVVIIILWFIERIILLSKGLGSK